MRFKRSIYFLLIFTLIFSSLPIYGETNIVDDNNVNEEEVSENQGEIVDGESKTPDENNNGDNQEKIEEIEKKAEENIEKLPMEKIMTTNGTNTVFNVTELQDAVANATGGDTITLADDFVYENTIIEMPDVNVTIDGGNKIWNIGGIKINGDGVGSITIENLKMDGSSAVLNDDRLINIESSAGKINLDSMEFYNAFNNGVIIIKSTSKTNLDISNSLFRDNNSVARGPAIMIEDNYDGTVDIKKSSFINNSGEHGGYGGGAIAAKLFLGIMNIDNTVFRNNINKSPNIDDAGGGGGAISIHYLYGGEININESLFEGNETSNVELSDPKGYNTYDGGAIYILDADDNALINIDKTTFDSNLAHDDGGAIMIQGSHIKNTLSTTNITNCTFYNNRAYDISGGHRSGGAIQFFRTGGSFTNARMTNNIKSSTFINNIAGGPDTVIAQYGGAIGLSGPKVFPTIKSEDSLFIGNQVYDSNGEINYASSYKDLTANAITQEGTVNLINVDKGLDEAATKAKLKEVLGTDAPELSENYSTIKAGVEDEIIKSIPIKPESIADNTYTGIADVPTVDQRDYSRYKDQNTVGKKIDQGAVEISWVKYNANGGDFGIEDMSTYDGTVYYEKDAEDNETTNVIKDKITSYYTVGHIAGDTKVLNGEENLKVTNGKKIFKGWAENKYASEADENYPAGKELTYVNDNITLYAIWEGTFTVTYDANGGTGIQNDKNEYNTDTEVIVLDKNDMAKSNYIFKGWNTKSDGTGTSYEVGAKFNITEDITLYAQWEEIKKPTEPTDPGLPIDPSEPVDPDKEKPLPELNIEDHFGYMIGYKDGSFKPNDNITRAEATTIFFRMLTENSRNEFWSTENNFKDVKNNSWYNNAVSTMLKAKVITIDEKGNFRPNDKITRAEFATLLTKFFNEEDKVTHKFTDIKGHWAEKEIGKVAAKGWIKGYEDGTFKPDQPITRAEAAKLVNAILERTPDINNLLPNMKEFSDNKDKTKWYYVEVQEATNSHEYERKDNKALETWTKLLPVRDWAALEKEWSNSNSSTNPGDVAK